MLIIKPMTDEIKNEDHGNCGAVISDTATNTQVFINREYSAEHLRDMFGISKNTETKNDTTFKIECDPPVPVALNKLPLKSRSV